MPSQQIVALLSPAVVGPHLTSQHACPSEKRGGCGAPAGGESGMHSGSPTGSQRLTRLARLLNRLDRAAIHRERCRLHLRRSGHRCAAFLMRYSRFERAIARVLNIRTEIRSLAGEVTRAR